METMLKKIVNGIGVSATLEKVNVKEDKVSILLLSGDKYQVISADIGKPLSEVTISKVLSV